MKRGRSTENRDTSPDLRDVRVLRLLDAEWLDRIEGAPRIEAAISAFRARGGVVETLTTPTARTL